jgi:hypothetical protein
MPIMTLNYLFVSLQLDADGTANVCAVATMVVTEVVTVITVMNCSMYHPPIYTSQRTGMDIHACSLGEGKSRKHESQPNRYG